MQKIASNVDSANAAVSGIKSVSTDKGQQTSLGESTVPSMTAGAEVSNQLLSDLSGLIDCVKAQSDTFPAIAEFFVLTDSQVKF